MLVGSSPSAVSSEVFIAHLLLNLERLQQEWRCLFRQHGPDQRNVDLKRAGIAQDGATSALGQGHVPTQLGG